MAKVTAGPLAGVVSGKLGSVVFSRGRYGAYMRMRVMPTGVSSDSTRAIHNRLSLVSKAWALRGVADRLAWGTWAATHPIVDRLGNAQVLHGAAAYMQLNMRVLQALGTMINVPPVASSPAPLLGLSAAIDVGAGAVNLLSWTSGATGVNECVQVWAAVVDSPGRAYYTNFKKLIMISGDQQATDLDMEAAITARFGSVMVGQNVFIEAIVVSNLTGLISAKAACETTVIST